MQRVVIVGPGGAGKSTLAEELGRRTRLPVIHLDQHFWQPGWVETPRDVWRAIQQELFSDEEWIADGNYGGTLDERLPHADTIVFCDFPAWRALPRVLHRWSTNRGQAVQAEDCPEHFDAGFLWWVLTYRRRRRPGVRRAIAEMAPDASVHVLRNPAAVEAFLAKTPFS